MKEKLNVNQIPELKQAIIDLPEKEKNQILIRLINKDQILIEHLHFKLLEDNFDLIKRYEDLKNEISILLNENIALINMFNTHVRAKFVLSLIRDLSGRINHFSKVTKNTYYELLLRLFLLVESSKIFNTELNEFSVFGEKFRIYQVAKLKTTLKLFEKLHEDLKYDVSNIYFESLENLCLGALKNEVSSSKIDYLEFKID